MLELWKDKKNGRNILLRKDISLLILIMIIIGIEKNILAKEFPSSN
jgi:hypothetical protein